MPKTKPDEPQLREGGPRVRRTLKVYGVEGLCIVFLTHEGIEIKAKRAKSGLKVSWVELIKALPMDEGVPSKFYGHPYEFLQNQAQQMSKRKHKRAVKKAQTEFKERTNGNVFRMP